VSAGFGFDDRLVEEIREVIGMNIGPEDYVAPTSAVAAIGSTTRNKLLSPEAYAPSPAVTGVSENFDSINKHDVGRGLR
jgi:hypothetical protein